MLSAKSNTGEEQNTFLNLTNGTKFVYLCMAAEAGGKREFEFTRTAAAKYGIANSSLRVAVEELIAAGMIERQSGMAARLPNLYRFCFGWKKPP